MVKRVTRNQKSEIRDNKTKKTIKKQEAGNRKLETSSEFLVPLTELLEAGCHFGHQTRRWNPKMSSFIYCAKDGVHIFDLVKTAKCLQEACLAAKQITSEGREIVFVGTKRQAQAVVKEEASKVNTPFVVSRWLGGTISNWEQIKKESIG